MAAHAVGNHAMATDSIRPEFPRIVFVACIDVHSASKGARHA